MCSSAPTVEFKNAEIADYCFHEGTSANKWVCKFCGEEKTCERKKHGPNNLACHVKSQHENDYKEFIMEAKAAANKKTLVQKTLSTIDHKVLNIYHWMDWMTTKDAPFRWSECAVTLKYTKLDKVDHKTLTKYFVKMAARVEQKIAVRFVDEETGDTRPCVILFDMWDDGSGTKYLAVFL
jgi:tetrahydrodipicolinate N-succinyltransferase